MDEMETIAEEKEPMLTTQRSLTTTQPQPQTGSSPRETDPTATRKPAGDDVSNEQQTDTDKQSKADSGPDAEAPVKKDDAAVDAEEADEEQKEKHEKEGSEKSEEGKRSIGKRNM